MESINIIETITQTLGMTFWEVIATVTGIIAVTLQAKEKIEAWPFAIVSVSILAMIFFDSNLNSDFLLHIIFLILNVYGWYVWSKKGRNKHQKLDSNILDANISSEEMSESAPILQLTSREMVIASVVILFGAGLLGYIMGNNTNADLPYFDAFTTSGSLVAQYLIAKKYLQNWIFWIIVDVVAVPVYIYKELYIVAILFTVFLALSIWGYYSWKREMSIA